MSMFDNPLLTPIWEVVTSTPGTGPDEVGRNVPGMFINFRLLNPEAKGAVSQVFVPNSDLPYPDKVKVDIERRAGQILALVTLKSG